MTPTITLYRGDCIEVMRTLPANSVDSIITDPPYGLGFMGKAWDDLPPGLPWAQECLRVLKPGGHLLAFGGTRTWHRLAVAVEDAGFEMRDSIAWLYGSGFPKSLDVSKAIDKAAGAQREVVGQHSQPAGNKPGGASLNMSVVGMPATADITAPATDAARQWEGWGTALKPAFEPIVVARKPLVGTVAANVQQHGTGALNIDGCRVGTSGGGNACPGGDLCKCVTSGVSHSPTRHPVRREGEFGRWPANVLLDGDQADALDKGQPVTTAGAAGKRGSSGFVDGYQSGEYTTPYGDTGGPSRFFPTFRYQAKAPASERPSYTKEGTVDAGNVEGGARPEHFRCLACGRTKSGRNTTTGPCECAEPRWEQRGAGTVAHPTVKPLALMRWLIRLVTPPGGVTLDPFAGSGTTVEAAVLEGFDCMAVEREADYLPLIAHRIKRAEATLRIVE